MHTASRPIRCAFCGPTHELDQMHHDACASCLTETVARLTTCPLEGPSLSQVPAATYDKLLDGPRVPAPTELLTELLALNGGHPVAPALAQPVWLLAHQLVESEQQLDALTAVLLPHGYLDNGETPWEAVQNAVTDAEEREAVGEALLDAGYLPWDEPLRDVVQGVLELAADSEEARELLLEAAFTSAECDLREAVRDAIATAAGAEVAREVLTAHRFMDEDEGLYEAVCSAVGLGDRLREARQELAETERQYIVRSEGYFRERQYRVNLAAVAKRSLLRAHAESHHGPIDTCETCASDWAVAEEASGVTAPGA